MLSLHKRERLKQLLKSFGLALIVCVFTFSSFASSFTYAEQRNFNPDAPFLTPFYNPGVDSGLVCSSFADIGISGENNGEKIWTYLIGRGLTPNQAAGIMGNLFQESGYLPHKQENPGSIRGHTNKSLDQVWAEELGGWGLAQWTFGRRDAVRDAVVEGLGEEYYTKDELAGEMNDELLLLQLEFIYEEMQVRNAYAKNSDLRNRVRGLTEWEAIQQMSTLEDALVLFHDSFERSADSPQDVINNRGAFAEQALNEFGDITSFGGQFCGSFATGDLQELVLEYAWSEYFPPPHFDMMPAYATAVRRAQQEGRYVGGGSRPGIDCGGFVTTLLIDSGFEPNYNYSGLVSDGASNVANGQRPWVEENWMEVGGGPDINVADLQPGDVAFQPGHTFVFVGDIEGFDSNIASASYGDGVWRTPMAGRENLVASNVTWYRKAE